MRCSANRLSGHHVRRRLLKSLIFQFLIWPTSVRVLTKSRGRAHAASSALSRVFVLRVPIGIRSESRATHCMAALNADHHLAPSQSKKLISQFTFQQKVGFLSEGRVAALRRTSAGRDVGYRLLLCSCQRSSSTFTNLMRSAALITLRRSRVMLAIVTADVSYPFASRIAWMVSTSRPMSSHITS